MQYHIQTLVKHLFDKDSFEQVTVQELKEFTDEFPYAAVGQFLYAQKLKDSGSYNHYEQSEQASLYFHNALWLRWQLDHKEEAPALPAKAAEAAQQPGFRIVVQMPKTTSAVTGAQPAVEPVEPEEKQPAENIEQEPVIQASETTGAAIPDAAEQDIQPAAEETTPPAPEEPVADDQEKGLTVNEDGSLVEHTGEPRAETPPVQEEANTTTETASTVAIAESSQLAEEIPADKEVDDIIPAVDTAPEVEAVLETVEPDKEVDDIIPAVDAAPEVETVLETVEPDKEVDDIIPAVEVTPEEIIAAAEEAPPVEQTSSIEETAPAEVTAEATETTPASAVMLTEEAVATGEISGAEESAPPEIITEEQAVEEVTETIAAEEPAVVSAEAEQPVNEVAGTTDTPPESPEAMPEEREQEATPEPLLSKQFSFTTASRESKSTVDLGEPIFESYHTIDYFASQGIKLMQEELKDKLGKQLKSFTDWLRSMKRIGPIDSTTSIDEVTNQSIQRIAEHSVEEKEVLTEAMAEVWVKQGNADKAIRVYEKLSLLNPAKSTYFAGRIEQLKAQ
jgi:hypothetical protein